jgi:hypothetical protein
MIDINDRVFCEAAKAKITTAEAAAALIKDGMNVGTSGFTPVVILRQFPSHWLREPRLTLSKSICGQALPLGRKLTRL